MAWTAWEKAPGFDFKEIIYEKKYHVELGGGVARITYNRPQQMNTDSPIMMRERGRALYDASNDPMIGVVVLTGAGDRAFSAGGDVAFERAAAEAGRAAYGAGAPQEERPEPSLTTKTCLKPVIARVNGYAIGGGHHQALECDVTIAAEHAIFGHNGPRVSSQVGGRYVSYPGLVVGPKKAREMNFTCRRYTAQEAFEMGLINKVVRYEKLDGEVDKWCEEILQASSTCISIRKKSLDVLLDLLPEGGDEVQGLMSRFIGSPEQLEGTKAFMEKRPTAFWKLRKELGEAAYTKKKG